MQTFHGYCGVCFIIAGGIRNNSDGFGFPGWLFDRGSLLMILSAVE